MRYLLPLAAIFVAGCLTSSYTQIERYTLEPKIDVERTASCDLTLGVNEIESTRLYRDKIVARVDEYSVTFHSDAVWAEMPDEVITRALMDGLVASGHFSDVADPVEIEDADYTLSGELRKFEELRTTQPVMAVCHLRLELREASDNTLVWFDTIKTEVPLESQNLESLAKAMSQAISDAVRIAVKAVVARTE